MRHAYLLPAALLLLAVLAFPLGVTIVQSFGHCAAALRDDKFWLTAQNTLVFTSISVLLEMALGLLFALLLNRAFPMRGTVRAITLIPWALPTAVMAMSWQLIFSEPSFSATHVRPPGTSFTSLPEST